jgi:hypothetical protein
LKVARHQRRYAMTSGHEKAVHRLAERKGFRLDKMGKGHFTLSILRRVDECRPAFPTTNILSHSKRPNGGSLRATTSLRASDITADLAAAAHLLSRPTTTSIIGGLVPSRPCEAGLRRLLALLRHSGQRSKSSGLLLLWTLHLLHGSPGQP